MTALDFTELTRRREPDRPDCWHVYCGDVRAGTIAKAATISANTVWNWSAGFYTGSEPGEIRGGSADTFEEARAAFLPAGLSFAQSRTPAHFEEWRDHRDRTAWIYQMHDQGMPMPTQSVTGRARCFCGEEVTIASVDVHVRAAHREVSA